MGVGWSSFRARLPFVAAALVLTVVLVAPVALFASFTRQTVEASTAASGAAERVQSVALGAALVGRGLGDTGRRLTAFCERAQVVDAMRAGDPAAVERVLRQFGSTTVTRDSLAAIDPSGVPIARVPPATLPPSVADLDYFSGALVDPDYFVSEVTLRRVEPQVAVVVIATAVRDGDRLLGVVAVATLAATLLDQLDPVSRPAGRELVLLDRRGRVIASTDLSLAPLTPFDLPAQAEARAGRSGTLETTISGRDRIVSYAPVGEAGWVLYALDDPAVVLAAEREVDQRIRAASGLVALAALVVAVALVALYALLTGQRRALALANRRLEDASRAKSEFLASMSHELRTPLNAILGFSDLLAEQLADSLSARQSRYLRNVGDAGRHLLGLINDVLDLARVEAGRVDLRREPGQLGEILAPVIASTRRDAEVAGLTFEVAVEADRTVRLDQARFRQILYNLLSNAVKFTPRGGRVTLRATVLSDGSLALDVEDTGIGIPSEKQDRLFGAFERLNEDRSDAVGTGLGLALTKRLVELHGGTIGVRSEAGRGATFSVSLPGVVEAAPVGSRVLIVEDEPRDAELVAALVVEAGFAPEVVGTAAAALLSLRRAPPYAVVLDLRLPDERGERVLEAIKGDPRLRSTPVIVVSVEDDDGHSRPLGADDHLTKPIDRARLRAWLVRVGDAHGKEGSGADPAG